MKSEYYVDEFSTTIRPTENNVRLKRKLFSEKTAPQDLFYLLLVLFCFANDVYFPRCLHRFLFDDRRNIVTHLIFQS